MVPIVIRIWAPTLTGRGPGSGRAGQTRAPTTRGLKSTICAGFMGQRLITCQTCFSILPRRVRISRTTLYDNIHDSICLHIQYLQPSSLAVSYNTVSRSQRVNVGIVVFFAPVLGIFLSRHSVFLFVTCAL